MSTLDHPFYVDGKRKDAEDLLATDWLTLVNGRLAVSEVDKLESRSSVYNFAVANTHTYYIGEAGVLVHNVNCVPSVANMKQFFDELPFGQVLKNVSSRTSKRFQGQTIFKATKNSGNIRKGDHFYLDNLHKDHIEVFDKNGNFRHVIGLNGEKLIDKTAAAAGRSIKDLL